MNIAFLLARLAFGGFFLYSGINHLRDRAMLARYASAKNVPKPDIAVTVSGVLLLIGGASIVLGIKPKYGALAIIGFLAGASPVMHNFWRAEEPGQRTSDMVNFSKNMALLGGALALSGVKEPWPASVPLARRTLERVRGIPRRLAA